MAADSIRNIIQSHQEREMVKTAPDLVVYLDGLPYVLNPWLRKDGAASGGLIVNFNEYITAANFSYGVDSLIPGGSVSLIVPSHHRYLFQAPGGNRIFNSMDEIQVYAKGYYFTKEGNSKYHRIFHGLVSKVHYSDTGTSLQINLQCQGLLRVMEIMRINMSPASVHHGDVAMTPFIDVMANLDPLRRIAELFNKLPQTEILERTSIDSPALSASQKELIARGYAAKWINILSTTRKAVRLFGLKDKQVNKNTPAYKKGESAEKEDPKVKNAGDTTQTMNESDAQNLFMLSKIKHFLPGMGVGQMNLVGSQIVAKIEVLRAMLNAVMFEGYQDIDGKVILKPPLFNLDVTKLSSTAKSMGLYLENNPFVIYPSEIEDESEEEDEQGIHITRVIVKGVANPSLQVDLPDNLKAEASFMDPVLMARFGIREDAPKVIGFMGNTAQSLQAFAVSELRKANRNWRTYSCTIPLRPELKLGFPIYLPHHDMYAYPSSIGISYNVGGRATMNIACNTLRKRPMIGREMTVDSDPDSKDNKGPQKQFVYASIPNLVMRMTSPSPKDPNSIKLDDLKDSGLTDVTKKDPSPEQKLRIQYFKQKLGNRFHTEVETTGKSWRIQEGTEYCAEKTSLKHEKVGDATFIVVDSDYVQKCLSVLPYTDERGYEVVAPFPWGRWMALDTAITEFTNENYVTDQPQTTTRIAKGADSFIFAGLAVVDPGSASKIEETLAKVAEAVDSSVTTSFELTYSSPESQMSIAGQNDLPENLSPDETAMRKIAAMMGGDCLTATNQSYRGALGQMENDVTFNPLGDGPAPTDWYSNTAFSQWAQGSNTWAQTTGEFLKGNT